MTEAAEPMNAEGAPDQGDIEAHDAILRLPAALEHASFVNATPYLPGGAAVRFVIEGRILKDGLAAIRINDAEVLTAELTSTALRLSLRALAKARGTDAALGETDVSFATIVLDLPEPSDVPDGRVLRFTCPHDALAKLFGVATVRIVDGAGRSSGRHHRLDPPVRAVFTYKEAEGSNAEGELIYREEAASAFAKPVADADADAIIRLGAAPVPCGAVLPWADIAEVGRKGVLVPAKLLSRALRWATCLRDAPNSKGSPPVCVEDGWVWGGLRSSAAALAFHAPRLGATALRIESARMPALGRLLDRLSDRNTRLSQTERFALFADDRFACGVVTTRAHHISPAAIRRVFDEKPLSGGVLEPDKLFDFPFSLSPAQRFYLGLRRTDEGIRLIASTGTDPKLAFARDTLPLESAAVRENEEPDENGYINAGWIDGRHLFKLAGEFQGKPLTIDLSRSYAVLSVRDPVEECRVAAALQYVKEQTSKPFILVQKAPTPPAAQSAAPAKDAD